MWVENPAHDTDRPWTSFTTGQLCCQKKSEKCTAWGGNLGSKLHPGGGFFGPWFFIILKNSHQDLSNEGSNNIFSSLEVGHWVAQTQPFLTNYQKLQILASYRVSHKDCFEMNVPLTMTFVWPFLAIFLSYVCLSFTKLRFWWSFWAA